MFVHLQLYRYLSLRNYALQLRKQRARFRSPFFGFSVRRWGAWIQVNQYLIQATYLALLISDHAWFEYSLSTRIRLAIGYSHIIDWTYHLMVLFFTILQFMLVVMPANDLWFVLTNYMLLDVVQKYKDFVSSQSDRARTKSLTQSQWEQWTEVERRFARSIRALERMCPGHYSPAMFTGFALQLVPEHVPNAPFKSKCSMLAMYVLMERFFFATVMGMCKETVILCANV